MVSEPVRAGSDWLALREPADAAARSAELVEELLSFLPEGRLVVHDLGCGTGAMARWLAPRLAGRQHWVLHDGDAALLHRVGLTPPPVSSDGVEVTVDPAGRDITRLEPVELASASLVTASALLDMMTAEELARFVDVCAQAVCPVLVTLTVVGRVQLTPHRPVRPGGDESVQRPPAARHRRGPGAGPGRRPRSGGRLYRPWSRRHRASQPLATRPEAVRADGGVVHRLAGRGHGAATRPAGGSGPLRAAAPGRGGRWIAAGHLTVHHEDLLALPRSPSAPAAPAAAAPQVCGRRPTAPAPPPPASPPAGSTSSASAPTTEG